MIPLSDVCEASSNGGCVVSGDELRELDLTELEGLDFRSVSERLLDIDDQPEHGGRCICRSGFRNSTELTPLDLLLAAHCDAIMVIGNTVAVMYPEAFLQKMRAALPLED